jgi:outer membrane protein OmpA-like peptidoglycan-associated protein
MAACAHDPLDTPVNWWHDLVGGEIAANRPPPPGADQPYPYLGTIPKKPTLPSASFRETVQTRLTEQRDDTQRLAARTPIVLTAVSTPPPPPPKPSDAPAADTANASLPGADAPPPKPAAVAAGAAQSDAGPAAGTPVILAGAPLGSEEGPPIPGAPPQPPTFEGVPAQPAPTPPPPLPAHLPPKLAGSVVLFAPANAILDPSQTETLKEVAGDRGHGQIGIEGHGETQADSPAAQAAALELGIKRAQAIATKLVALHVPQDKMQLGATAFGRDASVHLIP